MGLYLNKDSWGWLDFISLKRQSGIKKGNKTSVQTVGRWISEFAVNLLLDPDSSVCRRWYRVGRALGRNKEYCKGPRNLPED